MNRLSTLQQTLPFNLSNDRDRKFEFLLLDYNSDDGLEDWIRSSMMTFIKDGRLRFFQLLEPKPTYFSHSHSRNILFRLAKGDVLCNVNADYFLEPEFFETMPKYIKGDEKKAIILSYSDTDSDNFGRICVKKDDFFNIGGYDEKFVSHGYEDIDLCSRLILSGVSIQQMNEKFWSRFIGQDNDSRIQNSYDYHNVQSIHLKKINKQVTRILFLFKSGKAQAGTLKRSVHDVPILLEGLWQEGFWRKIENNILISLPGKQELCVSADISDGKYNHSYSTLMQGKEFNKVIFLKSQILNYSLMRTNIRNKVTRVNPNLGQVILKENFESTVVLDKIQFSLS